MTDTIFALATAPGRGAVAVMRVSGPGACAAVRALAGRPAKPRQATLRTLRDAAGGILDHALVLWFPGPASFTGEDCAEFHLHGGPAVIDRVTSALLAAGARLAQPGEFTRRAFENGKLDLSQAEGVADLVDAETAAQARQALEQLEGGLGRRYHAWRAALIEALAHLEAAIDFPEDDAAEQAVRSAAPSLQRLRAEFEAALADAGRGQRVREGYRIVLVGAPNSGKSSLINKLSDRDLAIISPIPGTTRDVIESPLVLGGYKVLLSDTAGLRNAGDAIEAEGARRAEAAADMAALRLVVADRSASHGNWRAGLGLARAGDACLLNKADLPEGRDGVEARAWAASTGLIVFDLSATTGDLAPLREWLGLKVNVDLAGSDFPATTRERHARLLRDGLGHLCRALDTLHDPDLAAEDVRLAARAVERVTGAIGAEDVLDRVFSAFCIGK